MPQLDVTTWTPQLVWLAIAFISLFLIMRYVALPRVGGVIESRKKRISDDLETAQRFKLETEKAIADYEAALAQARARGNAIAREARGKLNAETEQERAKVEAELNRKIADAEAAVALQKKKAMAEIEKMAHGLAAEIVAELAGIKPSRTTSKTALAGKPEEE
ncbi:MAG TPA: ATP F0F1 synthase subunit B [Aestuariivirgaceae bacterium]|jgi:F-type H+-transporting ATPase subunit b